MNRKDILIVFLLFFLPSCISYYDLKGSGKNLMPTVQETHDNKIKEGYKIGTACTTNVLMLLASGDSSIEAAKNQGNIDKISSVLTSYEHFWFLFPIPIYQKGCTIVNGD